MAIDQQLISAYAFLPRIGERSREHTTQLEPPKPTGGWIPFSSLPLPFLPMVHSYYCLTRASPQPLPAAPENPLAKVRDPNPQSRMGCITRGYLGRGDQQDHTPDANSSCKTNLGVNPMILPPE